MLSRLVAVGHAVEGHYQGRSDELSRKCTGKRCFGLTRGTLQHWLSSDDVDKVMAR